MRRDRVRAGMSRGYRSVESLLTSNLGLHSCQCPSFLHPELPDQHESRPSQTISHTAGAVALDAGDISGSSARAQAAGGAADGRAAFQRARVSSEFAGRHCRAAACDQTHAVLLRQEQGRHSSGMRAQRAGADEERNQRRAAKRRANSSWKVSPQSWFSSPHGQRRAICAGLPVGCRLHFEPRTKSRSFDVS